MSIVRSRVFAISLAGALGLSGAVLVASPAAAVTFPVATEAELIAAINDANATVGADQITVTAGITLTANLPVITEALTIVGQNNTITAGGFDVFNVASDGIFVQDLIIDAPDQGIVVADGDFYGFNLEITNATSDGIAITESTVLIADSTVTGSGGDNATISNSLDVFTSIEVRDSTFSGSVSDDGLQIEQSGSGTVLIDGVQADDNDDFGIDVSMSGTSVGTATNSNATGNGNYGVFFGASGDAHIELDQVDGDSGNGGGRIVVNDTAEIISTSSAPTSNTASGWFIQAYGPDATASFSNVLASLNDTGMVFDPQDGATITASNVHTQGGGIGLSIAIPFLSTPAEGAVIVTGADILEPDEHGVHIPATTSADLTLIDTSIHGVSTFENGAGILAELTGATLTLERSTIHDNLSGGFAGGAYVVGDEASSLVVVNSTIADNTGGALGGLAADLDGTVDVRNSTIVGNISEHGPATVSLTGQVAASVRNTIIDGGPGALTTDNGDTLTVDYSLVRTFEAAVAAAVEAGNNLTGIDPMLDPLADNGGPTLTMLPRAGSPVLNAGDPAFAPPPATDQRGEARVQGGRLDIGSVEVPLALAATGVESGAAVPVGMLLLLGGVLLLAVRRRAAH